MAKNKKPMSLDQLPNYIKNAREHGQDEIPVVQMGQIKQEPSLIWSWGLPFAYAATICVFIFGVGALANMGTKDIIIASSVDVDTVRSIVGGEGSVFSVKQESDGTYRVKVFTFKKASQFLNKLREKEEFEKVEMEN